MRDILSRYLKLRDALEQIENVGAEHPEKNNSELMFCVANKALAHDDVYGDAVGPDELQQVCNTLQHCRTQVELALQILLTARAKNKDDEYIQMAYFGADDAVDGLIVALNAFVELDYTPQEVTQ